MNSTFSILNASQARQVDAKSIQQTGIPSLVLMEHAAEESVKIIQEYITFKDSILVICGPGNNGADGLAIARLLNQSGYNVRILLVANHLSTDEEIQLQIVKNLNIPFVEFLTNESVIIDCLFGNGLNREIKDPYFSLIEQVNNSKATIFSIDVPSGLDATNGKSLGCCINATHTIALDCIKIGHLCLNGLKHSGTLHPVNIGIPYQNHVEDSIHLLNKGFVSSLLPERNPLSHKGTYGKGLMIGGSQEMHGAITMAAKAAYSSGVGTLTLMIPDCIGDIIASKIDFAMNLRINENNIDRFESRIKPFDFISIGNGMGQQEITKILVQKVLESDKPVILDADAFWAIQDKPELLQRKENTILTPHVKELSRIIGLSTKDIAENPIQACQKFMELYPNCTLVLKSCITVIGHLNQIYVLNNPNSALAKGGSGDILCGITLGMYAQTKEPLKAAVLASYIHNKTADTNKDPCSFLPEDSINNINKSIKELRK